MERGWLLRLAPPTAAAVAAGVMAATSIGAPARAWDPPPCPGGPERLAAAVRAPAPAAPAALAGETWFTLDPLLDRDGTLVGQRLRLEVLGGVARTTDLPPESAAAGPFGRLIAVTADDGRRSELRAIDAAAGCGWSLGTSADVVRRVTLDAAGTALYEFRVERTTREDLGVWRRPLDGTPPGRVLEPIPPDPEAGVTFTTTLGWTTEGDRLVVQSCGEVRCRTRILDPASGAVSPVPGSDHGEVVAVSAGHAVGYAACSGLPCPLVATDLVTGASQVLAEQAGLARLVAAADGDRIVVEAGPGRLQVHRADGGLERTLDLGRADLHLVPSPDRAAAGFRSPPGWIPLAPDGRSSASAAIARLHDGSAVALREVTR